MKKKIVSVPVPISVVYRMRRNLDPSRALLQEVLPFEIATVDIEETDVAFLASFGDRHGDVLYRKFDDVLWRPIIDAGDFRTRDLGHPLDAGIELISSISLLNTPLLDYPLGYRFGHDQDPKVFQIGRRANFTFEDIAGKIVSENRNEAIALASKTVEDDILEIGGVLHRRTTPPVWAAGRSYSYTKPEEGVELIMPDLPLANFGPQGGRVPGISHFEYDQRDMAFAFLEEFRAFNSARGFDYEGETVVEGFGSITNVNWFPAVNTEISSLVRNFDEMSEDLGPLAFRDAPIDLMAAYVDLHRSVQWVRDQEHDVEEHLESASEAATRLFEIGDRALAHWPRGHGALGLAHAISSRRAIEREYAATLATDFGFLAAPEFNT